MSLQSHPKVGRRGQIGADDALTVCKPTVSGTISLPSRGTFHLSLTVLCAIGRLRVLSLTRWSSQIHAGFPGSGATRDIQRRPSLFAYGAITLCGVAFQLLLLSVGF